MDREAPSLRLRWQPWLAVAVGVLASLLAARAIERQEDRAIRSQIERLAAERELAIRQHVDAAASSPRDRSLRGVAGAFPIGEIVGQALSHFQGGELDFELRDITSPGSETVLLTRNSPEAEPGFLARWTSRGRAKRESIAQQAIVVVDGRRWEISQRPSPAQLASLRTRLPLGTLLCGLLITALLGFYLARLLAAQERSRWEIFRREQVEDELRTSEERLRLTVETVTDDGGWDWNATTGELYLSDSWLNSLGYTRAELGTGAGSWTRFVHPADLDAALQALKACIDGSAARLDHALRIRTRSDGYRWFHNRAAVVARDAEGRVLRILGAQTDITDQLRAEEERRLLEQQLHHSQKLDSLGVLAGGIAHDFNNLLTAVLGNAELASKQLPPNAPAQSELEQISLAAVRAAELTSQMLAYAGQDTRVDEDVDLSELVEEMAQLIGASISKKAELQLDFGADLPLLRGDVSQIRQVVMNLLTNASDALGDASGVIRVATGLRHLDEAQQRPPGFGASLPEGDYLFLAVSDTGSGMSPEVRDRIFEPFFTTKFHGRGLGLAATSGIVESHGGAIGLESTPGAGTTVTVLLPPHSKHRSRGDVRPTRDVRFDGDEATTMPYPAQKQAGESRPKTNRAFHGEGHVLVIDDEAAVLRTARRCLHQLGFSTTGAANGREGLAIFRARPDDFVAVLLDLTMPELDGRETCRVLHELRPELPVLLCSGYADNGAEGGCASCDAGFLRKPYTLDALAEALRVQLSPKPATAQAGPPASKTRERGQGRC